MSAPVRLANGLFELREKRRRLFAGGLILVGVGLGLTLGLGAELAFLGGILGWLAWEARPRLYLALGMYPAAARTARALAQGAGPSFRGDVFRLAEVAACLNMGEIEAAKAAVAEVELGRLTPETRLVHFLNQATLYSRLGDGAVALAMVEAAEAEAEGLDRSWQHLPTMNRSLALFELGRYQDAAGCLRALEAEALPARTRAYLCNNLAWALALGEGDKAEALEYARKAVSLRSSDPYCRGTLGFCMVLAGGVSRRALAHMSRSLELGRARSPSGRALILAASAQAHREMGETAQAAALEGELRAMPLAARHLGRFLEALEEGGRPALLPDLTG